MLTQFNLSLIDAGIFVIAAWRLTHFIVHEDGPFNVMTQIRKHILRIRYNPDISEIVSPAWSAVFLCMWCLGWYVGISFLVLRLFILSIMNFVLLSLAISAVIIFIEKQLGPN